MVRYGTLWYPGTPKPAGGHVVEAEPIGPTYTTPQPGGFVTPSSDAGYYNPWQVPTTYVKPTGVLGVTTAGGIPLGTNYTVGTTTIAMPGVGGLMPQPLPTGYQPPAPAPTAPTGSTPNILVQVSPPNLAYPQPPPLPAVAESAPGVVRRRRKPGSLDRAVLGIPPITRFQLSSLSRWERSLLG